MARRPGPGASELTSEETQLLDADRAAEREAPAEEVAPQALEAAAQAPVVEQAAAPVEGAPAAPEAALTPEQQQASAVTQERERRRAAEKELRNYREKFATAQGRLDVLAQLAQQQSQPQTQAPAQPAIPDFNEDPFGHLAARLEQAETRAQNAESRLDQFGQQSAQQTNIARLTQLADAQERVHTQANPEYPAMAAHLRESREAELAFQGRDPAQIQAQLQADIAEATAFGLQRGMSFPEVVAQLAQMRGYRSPDPAPGAATAPAAPVVTPEQKIQQVARGQEQSQSLTQAPGAPPPRALTLEDIANMPEAEFAKITAGGNWKQFWSDATR